MELRLRFSPRVCVVCSRTQRPLRSFVPSALTGPRFEAQPAGGSGRGVVASGGARRGRSTEPFVPQVGSWASRCSPRRGELPGDLVDDWLADTWVRVAVTLELPPPRPSLYLWTAATSWRAALAQEVVARSTFVPERGHPPAGGVATEVYDSEDCCSICRRAPQAWGVNRSGCFSISSASARSTSMR
jgi:hypothetical protein